MLAPAFTLLNVTIMDRLKFFMHLKCVCVCVRVASVVIVAVLQQTVGAVAALQQGVVVILLHGGVYGPAHHLHASLCPVLDIVPEGGTRQSTRAQTHSSREHR